MKRTLALALLLAACSEQSSVSDEGGAGAALERTARASGMVADPARIVPTGVYASGEDKVCLVPQDGDRYCIGASIDLGEQQRCTARGTARGRDKLDVRMGGLRVRRLARRRYDRVSSRAACCVRHDVRGPCDARRARGRAAERQRIGGDARRRIGR